jgi:DNA-binding transcriptional regulator GbsR (MarR family)
MQNFILHWGEMGSKWGVNRSVAQIHALLHIAPDPLDAEEIAETLGLARSNVSTGLKELQGWKLVKASRALGERRDVFTSVQDMFDLVSVVVEGRREREFAPTIAALRAVAEEAEADATPAQVKSRMKETLETMQMFDDWYRDISRLPRSVQLAVMKLGGKIARFLP